ncbi:MAG TPA: septum formation initiator family protein [Desulfosporosinus sp.]|nr:septum formation initiator family protein [Desulfosporosinus sp.]
MKRTRQKIKTNHQNRKWVQIRLSSILVLCFAFAVVGSSGWQIWKLRIQVEGQLASLNQEKAASLQHQEQLKNEITMLNTPSYIEQLAREKLGLVKHGEILISPKK